MAPAREITNSLGMKLARIPAGKFQMGSTRADIARLQRESMTITDEQTKKIEAALDAQAKEQAALLEAGGFDFEKIQELQKTTADRIQGALTSEQKSAWTKMIGEPFELKGGFGGVGGGKAGFGGKQKGKGKKKDA